MISIAYFRGSVQHYNNMNYCESTHTSPSSRRLRVMLVNDCSTTQMCGVLRQQDELSLSFNRMPNVASLKVTSSDFRWGISAPYWREVRLVLPLPENYSKLSRMIEDYDPDILTFMTEGPLGMIGAIHCWITGRQYTTICNTRFDLYLAKKFGVLLGWSCKKWLQFYHSFSSFCIAPSPSMAKLLREEFKFKNVVSISNGCETKHFTPEGNLMAEMSSMKRPIWLYVGRISIEKNIEKFLELAISQHLPGTAVIVGDGPAMDELRQKYERDHKSQTPVRFLGFRSGTELEEAYRSGDIFVFPSVTDTFGLVVVEAMASGLPVAAFKDATGVTDIVINGETGCLHENLLDACMNCLENVKKYSKNSVERARLFSWDEAAKEIIYYHKYRRNTKIWRKRKASTYLLHHFVSALVLIAFGYLCYLLFV